MDDNWQQLKIKVFVQMVGAFDLFSTRTLQTRCLVFEQMEDSVDGYLVSLPESFTLRAIRSRALAMPALRGRHHSCRSTLPTLLPNLLPTLLPIDAANLAANRRPQSTLPIDAANRRCRLTLPVDAAD